jgi:hypothetical protein
MTQQLGPKELALRAMRESKVRKPAVPELRAKISTIKPKKKLAKKGRRK